MNRQRGVLAAFLTAALCSPAAALTSKHRIAPDPLQGLPIGSIKVISHEVFEPASGPDSKFIYRLANKLHSKTREAVIRRELLFAVGDRYESALLLETERNLRGLGFIRRAKVTAARNAHGEVDVTVNTYDAWSLEVVASFKRAGGATSLKGGLAEHNLHGEGKSLAATYYKEGGVHSETFAWKDRQFLNKSHLEYNMAVSAKPGARSGTISLARPFYASVARSALGATANYSDALAPTFSPAGDVNGAIRRRQGDIGVDYGVALGISTARVRRLTTGLDFRRVNYGFAPAQPPGPRPNAEQAYFVKLGLEWTELDFIKVNRMQKFSNVEDFNLGFGIQPSVLWAPPGLHKLDSTESQVLPKVAVRKAFGNETELLLLRGGYSSAYINPSTGNRTVSGDVLYFHRVTERQTLALHTSYDHGWRLDPGARLSLGEATGLRGYGLSQFAGDRRLLINVEDRLFLIDELFKIIDVGAVAFFDSGYVWPQGRAVHVKDLHNSVGVGLRLAPSRSSGNTPVRIDFARALSPNGTSSRWTVSILAGHAFGSD